MPFNLAHLGEGLSSSIKHHVDKITHEKLQKKLRDTQVQKEAHLYKKLGLSADDAHALADIDDEKTKSNLLSKLGGLGFSGEDATHEERVPQQEVQQFMQQLGQQAQQQGQPQSQEGSQQQPQPFNAPAPQQPGVQDILNMLYGGNNRKPELQQVAPKVGQPQATNNQTQLLSQQPAISMQPQALQQQQANSQESMMGSKIPDQSQPEMKYLMPKRFPLGTVSNAAEKQDRLLEHKDQTSINKQIYPYIAEVQSKAKGAKENKLRLDKMQKLIDTGELNSPQFAAALKTLKHGVFGFGLDLESLLTPESQEFNKLSQDFVKNAKDIFGSRITDTDLKSFLETVPTLIQSDEGKKAVIKNLKLMNEADEVRNRVARQLMKKYGNKLPLDFRSEVEDEAKRDLDRIAEKFVEAPLDKKQESLFPNIGIYRKK